MTDVVIIVPGLGDNEGSKILRKLWELKGVELIQFQTKWKTDENYESKLDRLLVLIDNETKRRRVSLIGTSAGGSLVVNAFCERRDKLNKVITVCARLRKGQIDGFRGFKERTKGYKAFEESVIKAEEGVHKLSISDRQKILTVHALFGDELVPRNTSVINQANNTIVPSGEHMLSIVLSLTLFSKPIMDFIKGCR